MQLPQYCIIAATHNYANLSHPVNQEFGSDAPLYITSVQAGAVLMPLAMFLLSLKSIRVLY